MLAPTSKHLLNKLAEIPSDVFWGIGDEDLEIRIRAFHQLFYFVNRFQFRVSREKIQALIEYLEKDFMSPGQPNYRKKGGIVGLSVLTTALGKKVAAAFLYKILPLILDSFRDGDISVCQYACETICVIAMVVKREIYPFFERIFYAFCLLFKHLDIDRDYLYGKMGKLTEYMATADGRFRWTAFNLHCIEEFVQFLKKRIRKMLCSARVYLLRWIENKSPHIVDSEGFLELYVEGLFQMLKDFPDEEEGVCDTLDKILQCIKEGQYRQARA